MNLTDHVIAQHRLTREQVAAIRMKEGEGGGAMRPMHPWTKHDGAARGQQAWPQGLPREAMPAEHSMTHGLTTTDHWQLRAAVYREDPYDGSKDYRIEAHPRLPSADHVAYERRPGRPDSVIYYDRRLAGPVAGESPEYEKVLGVPIRVHAQLPDGFLHDIPGPEAPEAQGKLWRGLSYEEMQQIKHTGRVSSTGGHNIGDVQVGVTYFADGDPHTARSYASGFAPAQYKPTFDRPAYIIGVRPPAEVHQLRLSHIPGEVGVTNGHLTASDITDIYEVRPYAIKPGDQESRYDRYSGQYHDGSGSHPDPSNVYRRVTLDDIPATLVAQYNHSARQRAIFARLREGAATGADYHLHYQHTMKIHADTAPRHLTKARQQAALIRQTEPVRGQAIGDALERLAGEQTTEHEITRSTEHEIARVYDDPARHYAYRAGWRETVAKYGEASKPELELLRARTGAPNWHDPQLSDATAHGVHDAIAHLMPTAPELPAPIPHTFEHTPENMALYDRLYHINLYDFAGYHQSLDLLNQRESGRWAIEARHQPGDINRVIRGHAQVDAAQYHLTHPVVPGEYYPTPVKRFSAARANQINPSTQRSLRPEGKPVDAAKAYQESLVEARKEFAGQPSYALRRERDTLARKLHFSALHHEQVGGTMAARSYLHEHARLAALDQQLAKAPHFSDHAEASHLTAIRLQQARQRAGELTDGLSEVMRRKVVNAQKVRDSRYDRATELATWQREGLTPDEAVSRWEKLLYFSEDKASGTTAEGKRLASDLHLLADHNRLPVKAAPLKRALGSYRANDRIEMRSARSLGGQDAYAQTLAHETGHHYAHALVGDFLESFSNARFPGRANRDEVIAEAIAHNLSHAYGSENVHTPGYLYRYVGHDPAFQMLHEPDIQRIIRESTAHILLEIDSAKKDIGRITEGSDDLPIHTSSPERTLHIGPIQKPGLKNRVGRLTRSPNSRRQPVPRGSERPRE